MSRFFYISFLIGLFAIFAAGQSESVNRKFDKAVKIISKPKAPWTDEAVRAAQLEGTVTLRVEFLSNRRIGQIFAVNGLPYGLTESAVNAAKKIRFIPALKNGKPVTVFRQVQYNFTLY